MSEEPDPSARERRRGSLFDLPTGPRRPTITGDSMTSASAPHEDDSPAVFKPPKKFDNTYKLEPDRKFRSSTARVIMEEIFAQLGDLTYDPVACSILTQDLATQIKERMKALGYDRYRFVVDVTVGEKKEQGVRMGSRAIWDTDRDTSASVSFENPSVFVVANLFAIYFE